MEKDGENEHERNIEFLIHKLKSRREKIPKANMERFFPPDEQEI